jgi:ribosomal protein S27AE
VEKCPRCGKEVSKPSKEWNYAAFHVKLFNCGKCDKTFKAYYRQDKLSHTIPKAK